MVDVLSEWMDEQFGACLMEGNVPNYSALNANL